MLGQRFVRELADGIELTGRPNASDAGRLVYFSKIHARNLTTDTVQARLERTTTAGQKRQATRYSVHGLHEYKGKFNPQIAKAILNIFSVRKGDRVLDPFCGSGTTLVECAQIGAKGVGTDLNPFAVFIAKAKLLALNTSAERLAETFQAIQKRIERVSVRSRTIHLDERGIYLSSWFDRKILSQVEVVRDCIEEVAEETASIFLVIASNLLRDYSLQDPRDLRIRRRSSPLPSKPYARAFAEACQSFLKRLATAQEVLGCRLSKSSAIVSDATKISRLYRGRAFDAALTSPPYAMALPYIDTQRLSLVWLALLQPARILELEAELIGSREMRGPDRRQLEQHLAGNVDELPEEQLQLCHKLRDSLKDTDGFRRKAVPVLLYRYFADMLTMFRAVQPSMKAKAPFALVVGHNHTVLGGIRYDLDTPRHLASLANKAGWQVEELIPLQTYQRYGYHMANAVAAETLVLLRNS